MAHQVKKNLGATLHRDGVSFCVWAPFAKSVAVAAPYVGYDLSNQVAMTAEDGGYWTAHVKDAEAGQSYKFLIDTGTEILRHNDPRARALTASDNGDSLIVGNDFDWGDDVFVPIPREQHIIYEMHIGTFNRRDAATQGTFYDAIEKLDYLQNLGINTIELMPVTSMAFSNGWGYNTNSIFSIENSYGGRRGLMEFLRACHDRNIGVIADVVYNHFFPETDMWQFDGWSENDRGGIYFYNDARGDTPWGGRPDFGRPEVRQYILDSIVMWFSEFRLDGLRLDSTAYMRNTQGGDDPAYDIPDAWSLLQEASKVTHKIRPGALIIAEDTSGNDRITAPIKRGGCGFDAQWGLSFPHAIRQALGLSTPYPAEIVDEIVHAYNGDAFGRVIFSDSHDTAANGHVRLNEAVTPGNPTSLYARQHTLIADAVTLTSPGIPMLLQGQEFMFGGAFNEWKELDWANAERHAGIVLAHKHLIALRTNAYGNTDGLTGQSTTIFHHNTADRVIGYHRWKNGGPRDDVFVIVNFSDRAFTDYTVQLPVAGTWHVRFNSTWRGYSQDFRECTIESITTDTARSATFALGAHCVLIVSQD